MLSSLLHKASWIMLDRGQRKAEVLNQTQDFFSEEGIIGGGTCYMEIPLTFSF